MRSLPAEKPGSEAVVFNPPGFAVAPTNLSPLWMDVEGIQSENKSQVIQSDLFIPQLEVT